MMPKVCNSVNPLVTFALFAYNQEQYIGEAVAGALAQTYSPLQIILSDDCSTDNTYNIMQEIVRDYSGPHAVILRRNSTNMGLGCHINSVMELVEGGLVVGAAGDDISLPDRVKVLVSTWQENGYTSGSIYSAYFEIDRHSCEIGFGGSSFSGHLAAMINDFNVGVHGCTHAWTKDLFDLFGPVHDKTVYEDRIIPFRSALVGSINYVNIPLVKYRKNEQSLSRNKYRDYRDRMVKNARNYQYRRTAYENMLDDLQLAKRLGRIGVIEYDCHVAIIKDQLQLVTYKINFLSGTRAEKLKTILASLGKVSARQTVLWLCILLLPRLYR